MIRLLLVGLFFLVLLLDWAALDDITTGKEPSLLGEYLILIISLFALPAVGYLLCREVKITKTKLSFDKIL